MKETFPYFITYLLMLMVCALQLVQEFVHQMTIEIMSIDIHHIDLTCWYRLEDNNL